MVDQIMTYNKYEHKTPYCLVIFHASHWKQGSAVLSYDEDLKHQSFEGGDNEYYSTIKVKQILQQKSLFLFQLLCITMPQHNAPFLKKNYQH